MWTHNGDVNGGTIQVVDSGNMTLDGKIDDHSLVVLISTGGSITVTGKIDNHSNVTLKAAGDVMIGTKGGDGDKKIDGSSSVEVVAGANVSLGSYIHQSTVDFSAHGSISLTDIDGSVVSRLTADGDISLKGKIDGDSRVDLVSNRGSVMIDGKIDGASKVTLTAGRDVTIGLGPTGGDDDRKIDGNSLVTAIAGGDITTGGGLFKDHSNVDFAAAGTVTVAKKVSGGITVRLLSGAGKITLSDGSDDSSTHITSWPTGALAPVGGATFAVSEWAPSEPLALTAARAGYWWENWSQTFGYVAPFRVVPHSLNDIGKAIVGSGNVDRPDLTPVKAVGGGWSFTDAALPLQTQAEVDQASIQIRGAWQHQDMRNVLEGISDNTCASPMDLQPQAVTRNVSFSTSYDQTALRQVTNSGVQLPASGEVRIIDTRSLASSLQCDFHEIRAPQHGPVGRPRSPREILFHVEAGITMADLQQLLDHQHPRLAIRASGGSPGATLAGALSTATHGGEFRWPLLIDCVRAVHLVGPGGEQWWIEGDVPVADQVKLQKRYPRIDPSHFIGAGWNAIPGLTSQDVLKAVAVSMGTMGVIYSMVIEVNRQFGLRQVVHPTSWDALLAAAPATIKALRACDPKANQSVLDVLINGVANGTGISEADNVYVDLAINPFNQSCWVVNREVTAVPDDANSPSPAIGDYLSALSRALTGNSTDSVQESKFAGRLLDFLSYATDVPGNVGDDINDVEQATRLMSFVTRQPDVLAAAVALANVQTVQNVQNASETNRGHEFLGDLLDGFFHALEGTGAGGLNSDRTGVSYKVGAIGWPDGGLPGRGLEIALDPTNAFTFLQTVLLDDVLANTMSDGNNPLFGYISIRVCPPTETLMGMQQYSPYSVMIEVVGYRSPEANAVMGEIQDKAIAWNPPSGARPLLHWGLENDKVTGGFLAGTPLGQPYKGTLTRLDAFRQIRGYLRHGNAPVFDNNFTARVGL